MIHADCYDSKQMSVRSVCEADSTELSEILNEIIDIGGTTAFEIKLSESEFEYYFVNGNNCISCLLVERDGIILGFQSLSRHPKLSSSWADIATFARVSPKVRGVGSILFENTLKIARHENISCINATIRADNQSGLAYYSKMGFKNYSVAKEIPLQDGTRIDRISKKYAIGNQ